MEHSLEREFRRAPAENPTAVLMIDLDHSKHFNDSHGHEVGDVDLRELQNFCRHNCVQRCRQPLRRRGLRPERRDS
jgi:diguanylate cyclase (GGDEF)-like protein